MVRCEVCQDAAAKYRCPRCLMQTCCLTCVKQHKINKSCNGLRDKTTFVAVKDMGDITLLNDYRFLEDACRKVNASYRDKLGNPRSKVFHRPRLQPHFARLKRKAAARGVTLLVLPIKFTRHQTNKSYYDTKKDILLWQVQWSFPQSKATYRYKSAEGQLLRDILAHFLDPQKSDPVKASVLHRYVVNAEKKGLHLYMKVERRKANSVRYHKLDLDKSLADNLKGKTIVEFPIIIVTYGDTSKDYPLLDTSSQKEESAPVDAPGEESDDSDEEPAEQSSKTGSGNTVMEVSSVRDNNNSYKLPDGLSS